MAGLEELVKQVRGGALHVPQPLEDGLQPRQDRLDVVLVRNAPAERVGQEPANMFPELDLVGVARAPRPRRRRAPAGRSPPRRSPARCRPRAPPCPRCRRRPQRRRCPRRPGPRPPARAYRARSGCSGRSRCDRACPGPVHRAPGRSGWRGRGSSCPFVGGDHLQRPGAGVVQGEAIPAAGRSPGPPRPRKGRSSLPRGTRSAPKPGQFAEKTAYPAAATMTTARIARPIHFVFMAVLPPSQASSAAARCPPPRPAARPASGA